MKNRILLYTAIFSLLTFLNACMEEDEKFATKVASDGDIYISIPENALPAPPAKQTQLGQPNFNVTTGRFAITDDVTLAVTLSEELTHLTINALSTAGARHEKASFSNVDGTVEWTFPVNQLGQNNAAPNVGSTAIIELIASNEDKSRTATRVFSVLVQDPLTIATSNPATGYADSLVTFTYSVPAATTLKGLTKVEVLVKRGKNGTEAVAKTKTYGAVTTLLADTIRYRMPKENPGGQFDTLYVKFKATYENGRTVTRNIINSAAYTVRFIPVPMAKTTAGITLYNPAVTGTNAARTGYSFDKVASVSTAAGDAGKDIKLVVNGLDIGFETGVGNTTRFLKATAIDYGINPAVTQPVQPTFESLRALFLAATPVTLPVSNVFVGDVYAVEIDGGTKGGKYAIFRVTAVTLTPNGNASDFITLELKSK